MDAVHVEAGPLQHAAEHAEPHLVEEQSPTPAKRPVEGECAAEHQPAAQGWAHEFL